MSLMDMILEIKPLKLYRIKNLLDDECDRLLAKAYDSDNRFIKNFFSQIVNCGKADACELLQAIIEREKHFSGPGRKIKADCEFVGLHKWLCLYNVLRFCGDGPDSNNFEYVRYFAVDFFELDDNDSKNYFYYAGSLRDCLSLFKEEFSEFLLRDVFMIHDGSTELRDFMSGFICEAYESFMKSFTNYVPMGSALYSAK